MYPFIRLLTTSMRAAKADAIGVGDVCESSTMCMPWDIDMFLEMNNGRVLTIYDLGRFDIAIRTGLAKVLKANRWGLVVAGCSVRYRKRIKMFDKITIRTQVVAHEGRWFYIEQSMWVKGQPASSILLRTGVTAKGTTVPTEDVMAAMNEQDWQPEISGWVRSWIDSDNTRPWPPA